MRIRFTKLLFILEFAVTPFSLANAETIWVDLKTGKQLQEMKALSDATATQIEIPQKALMDMFNQMKDGEDRKLPIVGGDTLHISRSANHLDVIAIVDNIGTDIKIRKRVSNFSKISARGGRVILDKDEGNIVNIIVIAGNVGTVIDINLNIDHRKTAVIDKDSDEDTSPADNPSTRSAATATQGLRYYVKAGQTLRLPRGYSEYVNQQWKVVNSGDITVTFTKSGYIYAH